MTMTFGEAFALYERKDRIEQMIKQILPRLMGDNLELSVIFKKGGQYSDARLKDFVNDTMAYLVGAGAAQSLYAEGAYNNLLQDAPEDKTPEELIENCFDDSIAGDKDAANSWLWNRAQKEFGTPAWLEDYLYCVSIAACAEQGLASSKPTLTNLYKWVDGLALASSSLSKKEAAEILKLEQYLNLLDGNGIAINMELFPYYDEDLLFSKLQPSLNGVFSNHVDTLFNTSRSFIKDAVSELDALYMLAFQKSPSTLQTKEQKALAKKTKQSKSKSKIEEPEEDVAPEDYLEYLEGDLETIPSSTIIRNRDYLETWRANVPFKVQFEEHYQKLRAAWLDPKQTWNAIPTAIEEQLKDAIRFTLSDYGLVEWGDREAYFAMYKGLSQILRRPNLGAKYAERTERAARILR